MSDYCIWDHATGTWKEVSWEEYVSVTGEGCPHTDRIPVYTLATALTEPEHVADICKLCDANLTWS